METRINPNVAPYFDALQMIANGEDMWEDTCDETLKVFRNNFIFKFSALPTNTQFTKRGVKESGFVSLGRRGEVNRSILAIARGRYLPDALKIGRAEVQPKENVEKKKQLQGEKRTSVLMRQKITK